MVAYKGLEKEVYADWDPEFAYEAAAEQWAKLLTMDETIELLKSPEGWNVIVRPKIGGRKRRVCVKADTVFSASINPKGKR